MQTYTASQTFAWSREQLFDLAADVERYPQFLPGWIDASILERSDQRLRVRQQLGLQLLRQPFISTATLQRPERISIDSEDGPFRCLHIEWRFETVNPAQTGVSLSINLQLHSRFLETMAGALFNLAAADIVARFGTRAHQIYGPEPA